MHDGIVRVAWRAWWTSVAGCAIAAALFALIADLLAHNRRNLLHNVVDYTGAVTLVFAAVCATVIVPAFLILAHAISRPPRGGCLALGVCLSLTTLVAFSLTFREHDDPQTVVALIEWVVESPRMLWGAVIASVPYVAAGLVFGHSWASVRTGG